MSSCAVPGSSQAGVEWRPPLFGANEGPIVCRFASSQRQTTVQARFVAARLPAPTRRPWSLSHVIVAVGPVRVQVQLVHGKECDRRCVPPLLILDFQSQS